MKHSNDPTLLSTHSLTVGYTSGKIENQLFANLNLVLTAGKLVCFMGINGIGKSSLIRTLAGLQKPLSGKVICQNQTDDRQDSLHEKISIVLTDKITTANLTVRELITYGRYPYLDWNLKLSKKDKDLIDDSIDRLHLRHLVDRKLYELSDGQLQLTMIARALTQDTSIILLDEPTAHLDLNNRVEIMNLLLKISHETKKAVLIATHELDLALQTADLLWLADQKNILTGIPEDLVLNGALDSIFRFKGFDLKTGKMRHEPFRNITVKLAGEGAVYLWTKNALERNGYKVALSRQQLEVILSDKNDSLWEVFHASDHHQVSSLEELIEYLQSIEIRV